MSARPWFKFFPTDWRADAALRMCSLGARGLWLEMVCLMDEAEPRGYLTVKGKPVTPKQLAILAGCTVPEVTSLLSELEEAEVFSRGPDGTILSRRMVRETRVSGEQASRATKRWDTEKSDLFGSGIQNTDAEHDAHMPEARSQRLESESESKASPGRRKPETALPAGFPDQRAILEAKAKCDTELADVNVPREAEKFRNYATANDRRYRDWPAAWRTWIGNSIERAPRLTNVVRLHEATPDEEHQRRKHRVWMADWRRAPNQWDHQRRGPKPDEPGCQIPLEIMREFGYVPAALRAEG